MAIVKENTKIIHDQSVCTACGICELMCSIFHEDVYSPSLSRSRIIRQPFTADHEYYVCQQCQSPNCYEACPLKDSALCIDSAIGIVYINEDECTGCGECKRICPKRAIALIDETASVNYQECIRCYCCHEICPVNAIKLMNIKTDKI